MPHKKRTLAQKEKTLHRLALGLEVKRERKWTLEDIDPNTPTQAQTHFLPLPHRHHLPRSVSSLPALPLLSIPGNTDIDIPVPPDVQATTGMTYWLIRFSKIVIEENQRRVKRLWGDVYGARRPKTTHLGVWIRPSPNRIPTPSFTPASARPNPAHPRLCQRQAATLALCQSLDKVLRTGTWSKLADLDPSAVRLAGKLKRDLGKLGFPTARLANLLTIITLRPRCSTPRPHLTLLRPAPGTYAILLSLGRGVLQAPSLGVELQVEAGDVIALAGGVAYGWEWRKGEEGDLADEGGVDGLVEGVFCADIVGWVEANKMVDEEEGEGAGGS